MAVKVCDTEPCDKLKRALIAFFEIEVENYDPEKGLMIAKLVRKTTKGRQSAVETLNFKYCPFCGTRVALGLVDGLEEDRYRVQRLGA